MSKFTGKKEEHQPAWRVTESVTHICHNITEDTVGKLVPIFKVIDFSVPKYKSAQMHILGYCIDYPSYFPHSHGGSHDGKSYCESYGADIPSEGGREPYECFHGCRQVCMFKGGWKAGLIVIHMKYTIHERLWVRNYIVPKRFRVMKLWRAWKCWYYFITVYWRELESSCSKDRIQ